MDVIFKTVNLITLFYIVMCSLSCLKKNYLVSQILNLITNLLLFNEKKLIQTIIQEVHKWFMQKM